MTIDFAKRLLGIGGSDAAQACGLSPWGTVLELYLEKTQPYEYMEPSEAMIWGTRKEPLIRQRYAEVTGNTVLTPDTRFQHPQHDFAFYHADGVIVPLQGEDKLFEAKTARDDHDWGEPGSDEIPDVYMCQVQHGMGCTGLDECDLAVLIGSSDFRIYHVSADEDLQADLFAAEAEFWRRVEERDPPDPVNLPDARLRWPRSEAKTVEADDEIRRQAAELRQHNESIAALESVRDGLKLAIQTAIGANDTLVDSSGNVLATWKSAKGGKRFAKKEFAAAYPVIFERYQVQAAGSRRFLLKKPRPKKD